MQPLRCSAIPNRIIILKHHTNPIQSHLQHSSNNRSANNLSPSILDNPTAKINMHKKSTSIGMKNIIDNILL